MLVTLRVVIAQGQPESGNCTPTLVATQTPEAAAASGCKATDIHLVLILQGWLKLHPLGQGQTLWVYCVVS